MTRSTTDRIEKSIHLRAPRSRVWRALTDAEEFGAWFLVDLDGPFVLGERVTGRLRHPDCDHLTFEAQVERMEPEHAFSFRWHPDAAAIDEGFGVESTTLVEFSLEEFEGGTQLTVVESGFDKLPPERRSVALRMNTRGWDEQVKNIAAYVEH